MFPKIDGIHHVTAIAGEPQKNIDFYVALLGLRMVKRTVNFDDPGTYHLYYGNGKGSPGTIMTFFPWPGASLRGRAGAGQVTVTMFSIPVSSLGYWIERFEQNQIEFNGPFARFDEEVLRLKDPDGLVLELIATETDKRPGWENGDIPAEHSIRGFFGAALTVNHYERTGGLLTETFAARSVAEKGNRFRYAVGTGGAGTYVDVLCEPNTPRGEMGVGAVHHLAWRIKNDELQDALRDELIAREFHVTPMKDRKYFHSIYFREPGGVLFEIATDPPGFAVDEPSATMGQKLMLPPWLEDNRTEIEAVLPKIIIPGVPS